MYVYVLIDLSSFIDLPNQGTVVLNFLFLVVAKLSQASAKLAQLSYIITINCQHPTTREYQNSLNCLQSFVLMRLISIKDHLFTEDINLLCKENCKR